MLDDETIRIIAGGILVLSLAGLAVVRRSVSRPGGKAVAARRPAWGTEAAWVGVTLLVQGWTLGVLLLPNGFYDWPNVGSSPDASAVQLLGPAFWLVGMGLAAWATRTLGRFMTVSIQVTEGHRLVQEGPYAWIRHPIYTGNVLAALGLSFLYLSPPLAALALVILGLAAYRGRIEDEFLRTPQAFGEQYAAYAARTGRFLPRFRRFGP